MHRRPRCVHYRRARRFEALKRIGDGCVLLLFELDLGNLDLRDDLRTFSIRGYPVDKVPELRPGMSAYLDWRARE
jgi:hypothetical protein